MATELEVAALTSRIASLEKRQRIIIATGLATAALCGLAIAPAATFGQDRPNTASQSSARGERMTPSKLREQLRSERAASLESKELKQYADGFFVEGTTNHGWFSQRFDDGLSLTMFDVSDNPRVSMGIDASGNAFMALWTRRGRSRFWRYAK